MKSKLFKYFGSFVFCSLFTGASSAQFDSTQFFSPGSSGIQYRDTYTPDSQYIINQFKQLRNLGQFVARGLSSDDEGVSDEMEKAIVESFGSLQNFFDAFYLNQVRIEYYTAQFHEVDRELVPRIYVANQQYPYFESARIFYNQYVDSIGSIGRPLSPEEVEGMLTQWWHAAEKLEAQGTRRESLINQVFSLEIDLSHLNTTVLDAFSAEDLADETIVFVPSGEDGAILITSLNEVGPVGAAKRAVESATKELSKALPHWSKKGRHTSVLPIIVFLWRQSREIQSFAESTLPIIQEHRPDNGRYYEDVIEAMKGTRDWLEKVLPVDLLAEDERKSLSDDSISVGQRYYFVRGSFERETELTRQAQTATSQVSQMALSFGESAISESIDWMSRLSSDLDEMANDISLMSAEEALRRRREFSLHLAARRIPVRLGVLRPEDRQILAVKEGEANQGADQLRVEFRKKLLDADSNYSRRLKGLIDSRLQSLQDRLEEVGTRHEFIRWMVEVEARVKSEIRRGRFNQAKFLIEWARRKVAEERLSSQSRDHRIALETADRRLDQFIDQISVENTSERFKKLVEEVYLFAERLSAIRQKFVKEADLDEMVREVQTRVALCIQRPDCAFEVEKIHHTLEESLEEVARAEVSDD